jgi:redox-sensitive bicupin YhaK (pirin superfamily)
MTQASVRTPSFTVVRSSERAHGDHGWLDTYYSFSFADYLDPANVNWGALRVFNDDTIAPSAGFPVHPHRDMEIVTYVLSGELAHQDSMGNQGVVGRGGIQFMSAGTGVRHSEYNNSATEPLHLVQMWVIPGRFGMPPSYGQMAFEPEQRRNRWLPVVSGEANVTAPIRITQQATLRVASLKDAAIASNSAPARYGFLFVAEGKVRANGTLLERGDSVRLFDTPQLDVAGTGELVFWDLPALNDDSV